MCEVATIGVERLGSRLGSAVAGWKAPKSRLILANLFAATLKQKVVVIKAWRLPVVPPRVTEVGPRSAGERHLTC